MKRPAPSGIVGGCEGQRRRHAVAGADLPLGPVRQWQNPFAQGGARGLARAGCPVGWMDATMEPPSPTARPGPPSCWTMCTCTRRCSSTRHSTGLSMRRPTSAGCWQRVIGPGAICRCATICAPGWAGGTFSASPLSEPERRAVLRQAADARGVFLSDEVMDFHAHPLQPRPGQPDGTCWICSMVMPCKPNARSPSR
jgi:hypothetical protein